MTFDQVFDPKNERHIEAVLYRMFEFDWPDWFIAEMQAVGYTLHSLDWRYARNMIILHYAENQFSEMFTRFRKRNDFFID